jgi:hypothetical protein
VHAEEARLNIAESARWRPEHPYILADDALPVTPALHEDIDHMAILVIPVRLF